jgi:hypothetical protein
MGAAAGAISREAGEAKKPEKMGRAFTLRTDEVAATMRVNVAGIMIDKIPVKRLRSWMGCVLDCYSEEEKRLASGSRHLKRRHRAIQLKIGWLDTVYSDREDET